MPKILPQSVFLLAFTLAFGFAKPLISVSIPPQEYFVKKIAGDTLQINVIVPAGTDEHNFELKPATMQKLEKSDIYFTIGIEIEKNLTNRFQSVAKNLRIVDTGAGLRNLAGSHEHAANSHEHEKSRLNSHENERVNSHGLRDKHANSHAHTSDESSHNAHSENSHAHHRSKESKDPHIWLDPILVKQQANIIANALIAVYPHNQALYEANLAAFQSELDALHAQISALLADKKGKKFIIYHPSLGYFAARYDLVQIPVEFEGKEPKARDLQRLIDIGKKEKIKTIFVQKGFPQSAAKSLAKELDAHIVPINHLNSQWQSELLKSAENLGR